MTRILVCGGRDYHDFDRVDNVLSKLLGEGDTLIQGGARGADALAKQWAFEWHVSVEEYPADWKKYGRGAGPIRNQQMLDEGKPDLVVAFKGGTGTADMVRRAKKAGIPVTEVA
jgi:hypothetical protein